MSGPTDDQKKVTTMINETAKAVNERLRPEMNAQTKAIEVAMLSSLVPLLQEALTNIQTIQQQVTALTTAKKATIKAPVETTPGTTAGADPVKVVKTKIPAVNPLGKAFNNKLNYIKAISTYDRALYEKLIPVAVINTARKDPSYVALTKTSDPIDFDKLPADAVKRLRTTEANLVYVIIKGGGEHKATFDGLEKAMKEHQIPVTTQVIEQPEANSD